MFKEADIYLAIINNDIVGFLGMQSNYIAGIFIKSEYQNKGIGGKLLNYVKENNDELLLSVYEKNKKAYNFYLKNRFTINAKNIDKNTDEQEIQMKWSK